MMEVIVRTTLFLLFFTLSTCCAVESLDCPPVETEFEVNVDKFTGKWYKVAAYPFGVPEAGKCETVDCLRVNNHTFFFSAKQYNAVTNQGWDIVGMINVNNPLESKLFSPRDTHLFHWKVLDADYQSYAVTYGCAYKHHRLEGKLIWVLSREKYPNETVWERAYGALNKFSVPVEPLSHIQQNDCDGFLERK